MQLALCTFAYNAARFFDNNASCCIKSAVIITSIASRRINEPTDSIPFMA
jgi:hypothetical protein